MINFTFLKRIKMLKSNGWNLEVDLNIDKDKIRHLNSISENSGR